MWDWTKNVLSPNLASITWYNGNQDTLQTYLIGDYSSIIFSYAIIKQKRIKDSKYSFKLI